MGFSPQEIDGMSVWKFMAACEGYAKAHSTDDEGLSSKEVDELWEWLSAAE